MASRTSWATEIPRRRASSRNSRMSSGGSRSSSRSVNVATFTSVTRYRFPDKLYLSIVRSRNPVFPGSIGFVLSRPPGKQASLRKRGGGFVWKVLFEAALAAVRLNPAVRETYAGLKGKGKPEKAARIAVALKLLLVAHAVYRSGQPYRTSEDLGG